MTERDEGAIVAGRRRIADYNFTRLEAADVYRRLIDRLHAEM